jgi:hypothetical protein
MATCAKETLLIDPARRTAARLGSWIALLTAAATIVSFAVAIFTPPRSGPFCTGACVGYPYSATAAFFPRDYLWMFPSLLMTPLFVTLCACVDLWVDDGKRIFSRIALAFAAIAAALITLDYFIQIQVVQPSLLKRETEGLALFSQYNPHGLFIAMEDLGYLMMSASLFFLGAALSRSTRLEISLRILLRGGALLAFATFIGMSLYFGNDLETRFELAIITISWTALTIASLMLGILFRRTSRQAAA